MINFIKRCDYLSSHPKLNISGNSRINNLFGGITTITICIVAVSLISYHLNYYLEKKDFLLSSNKQYNSKQYQTVNTSEIFYAFNVIDSYARNFKSEESLFNVYATHFKYDFQMNRTNHEFILTTREINISKCPIDYKLNSTKFDSVNREGHFLNSYCIEPNQIFNISNPFGASYNFEYLNIYVTKCSNKTICKNENDIDKELSSMTISTSFIGFYVDNSNYTSPFQNYIYTSTDFSSSSYFKRQFIFLKNILYQSDNGIFTTDLKEEQETTFDSSKELIDFRSMYINNQKVLFQITIGFNPLGLSEIFKRKYIKFQITMAEAIASFNIFKILSTIIVSFYSDNLMIYEISKEFICIDKKEAESNLSSTEKNIINENSENICKIPFSHKRNNIPVKQMERSKTVNNIVLNMNTSFFSICKFLKCKGNENSRFRLEKCINSYLDINNFIKIQNVLDYIKHIIFMDDVNRNLVHNLSNLVLIDKNPNDCSIIKLKNEIECILHDSNNYDIRLRELVQRLFK